MVQSRAVRLHGKSDLRVDEFDLPQLGSEELLLEVQSSAVCTSCHKTTVLGEDHHRVPNDISTNPVILGHEFSATIIAVGSSVRNKYNSGDLCIVQPMIYESGSEQLAVGHSIPNLGGYATHVIVPESFVRADGVLLWKGSGFYRAALAEPLACIIAAFRSQYHTGRESYKPMYGTKPAGKTLFLAGSGSMGFLSTLLWQIRADKDSELLIYDRNEKNLERLNNQFVNDPRISSVNANSIDEDGLRKLSGDTGFDDIVVFAASESLVSLGLNLLGFDGCLNMFAGPIDSEFSVSLNFHAVHYERHHIVGSSGASREDFVSALDLLVSNKIDPSFLVTHIGGIDSVVNTVTNLPEIGGAKKVIYPHLQFPLTEVNKLNELAKSDVRFETVAEIVRNNHNQWCEKAESALLEII